MGYQQCREEFIGQYCKHVPNGRYADAIWFLRQASAEQRWNEVYCSFDIGEKETERQKKRSERRIERIQARAAALGLRVETQGDPRGNPFSLFAGDVRLSVPGRGLPARCFQ